MVTSNAGAEIESLRHDIERYKRFVRALTYAHVTRVSLLDKLDFAEWVQEQAQMVIDGFEAECPNCCTPLHEGACVDEEDSRCGDWSETYVE